MKWIAIIFIFYSQLTLAHTAIEFKEILEIVESRQFEFQFRGKLFGFYSTQSCVYRSDDILLIRNYCHDDKFFPAKSYYIISPTLGWHYLYEEDLGGHYQREITLKSFPEDIVGLWSEKEILNLDKLNLLLEALYYDFNSACWVTNFSKYKSGPHSDCYKEDIANFPLWKSDSENLVFDEDRWNQTLKSLRQAAQH
ncbi:MAG: hypothetical protein KDD58_12795 [Bdellovibrionales bacterium]|nr:hypothetical protein [Bdellovibrionales bacterium]